MIKGPDNFISVRMGQDLYFCRKVNIRDGWTMQKNSITLTFLYLKINDVCIFLCH